MQVTWLLIKSSILVFLQFSICDFVTWIFNLILNFTYLSLNFKWSFDLKFVVNYLKKNSLGMIKLVSKHRAQVIYTRNTKGTDEGAPEKDA